MRHYLSLKKAQLQKGAVLIVIAFILGLGATAFLLNTRYVASIQIEQDERTYKALNEAKQGLMAWSVSHPNIPGLMPYPDRNGDGNYDDTSDCYASTVSFSNSFTIGRLPLYKSDNNCINGELTISRGLTQDLRDGLGERLWLEVSSNLLYDYKTSPTLTYGTPPIINPSIMNHPKSPWLTVVDRTGAVLSNRVAVVIISAGGVLGNQNRSGGIANANQYLDAIVMADGTSYQNFDYPNLANNLVQKFMLGENHKRVSKNDPSYQNQSIAPYNYNDQLVYITIDELMRQLEARAAAEATHLLIGYKAKTGQFPYASPLTAGLDSLGAVSDSHKSQALLTKGMLPIDSVDACDCPVFQSCTCSFKAITGVAFTKNSGTFSAPLDAGACISAGKKCSCTGAGSCSRSTVSFSCDAQGACNTNQTGVNVFTYTIPSYVGKPKLAGNCILNLGNVVCNGVGSFLLGLQEHAWFKDNLWQDYFYYAWSPTSNLQAGAKLGISALLLGAGDAINSPPYVISKGTAQSRAPINASPNIADYLDSFENTDGNQQFEATSKQKTINYNDQTFIVAP